ncbi:hypothetical protein [Mucilaginibacter sp. UYCu711]|uniref:hypothetical protein n=1 Tax=Mucilaginibacter sp. UYCu711 TaxID=3156339 RepID=UPI003D1EFB90
MDIQTISDNQKQQLINIIPSDGDGMYYYPCQIKLKSRLIIDNVYLAELGSYLRTWGVMPDQDAGKQYILIENVDVIKDSPNRLPPNFANKLYKAAESGMGYCLFKILFDNGTSSNSLTGNAVDFVTLPMGLSTKNIVDVVPNQGSRTNYEPAQKYWWCLYQDN